MYFDFVYNTGKKIKIFPKSSSLENKFKQVEFPYTSAEFLSGIFIWFIIPAFVGIFFFIIGAASKLWLFELFGYIFIFTSVLLAISSYLYGASIYYTQGIIQQKEEMLQALLEMANYISLNTSIEFAFTETAKGLTGVLGKQFKNIVTKLELQQYATLGDAFEDYIPVWMEINPDFVKGLTILQTASLAPLSERDNMLKEGIKTIMQGYYTMGKRTTETLSNQAKNLVSVGVMLPMMSLILLPMMSIFLPNMINVPLLIFIYDILCPALLLLFAMNFALNRVQVNTIDLSLSPKFKKMPQTIYLLCILVAIIVTAFGFSHLFTIDMSSKEGIEREYKLESLLYVWLIPLGIFLAVELYLFCYIKLNEKIWLEMREVEDDIPHLLQVVSSYLVLNRPMESIIEDVKEDYIRHGFKRHAVVKIFSEITDALYNTKKTLIDFVNTTLPEIVASKRLIQIFRRLIHFSETDIKNAAKAAKMIRSHTLSIFRLDNYMQTLLSDTSATIELSGKILAPILAATAIIMAVAIVMALEYIIGLIEGVGKAFGIQISLQLVDVSAIIPPTVVLVIVGIYLILTMIVLSLFLANVKYGTDRYKIGKTIFNNLLVGFLIFSALFFIGVMLFTTFIFKGVLVK
ncbi:MAG: hypothetical protein N3F05_02390 [Candidatus Diapherotrites archaeon]|nr:hypothetical protein [Candidatus Diapherotrites archaeon]